MTEFNRLIELEKRYYSNCELEPISQYIKEFPLSEEKQKSLKEYKITDIEYLAVLLLCGNQAKLFQKCRIEKRIPNELELALSSLLDSVLEKMPPSEFECLVRYDCYSDISNYKENEIITIDYYLTTTIKDMSVADTKIIWVITPLPKNETNARCIYPIRDIEGVPEYQINFIRETKFKIDRIKPVESESYFLMYVTEVK